jgi:hypothetical protein
MCEEKYQELGRPWWLLGYAQVGGAETTSRDAEGCQGVGSAHSTLRRQSRSRVGFDSLLGEGADRQSQPIKETLTGL